MNEKVHVCYRDKEDIVEFEKGGYMAHGDYMNLMVHAGYYYGETEIIDKINRNEEGFFDFSKAIIDIGSEIGVYSMGTNFSRFYLFEGNKEKFIISEMNMVINEKTDLFEGHNVLLSDRDEEIDYDGFTTEYSEVPEGIYKVPEIKKTKATYLDKFNIQNVGLIKIDVEGMEEKVIRGGLRTIINNNYPPILFECWIKDHWLFKQERQDSLEKLLRSLGYDIIWEWGDFETHLAIKR